MKKQIMILMLGMMMMGLASAEYTSIADVSNHHASLVYRFNSLQKALGYEMTEFQFTNFNEMLRNIFYLIVQIPRLENELRYRNRPSGGGRIEEQTENPIPEPTPEPIKGDLTGDGKVNQLDVMEVQKNWGTYNDDDLSIVLTNQDGSVPTDDELSIYLTG